MAMTQWQRPEMNPWSPFRHLSFLRDEIGRLFESPLAALTTNPQQFMNGWLPRMDLFDDGDHLIVRLEVPGMKKEEIEISLHGDMLTVSGERREQADLQNAETYRAERMLGRFQRTLTLPIQVDSRKVEAVYCDGILAIRLPKAEEAKPRQIEVKAQ
jgi:HSP20 family protein